MPLWHWRFGIGALRRLLRTGQRGSRRLRAAFLRQQRGVRIATRLRAFALPVFQGEVEGEFLRARERALRVFFQQTGDENRRVQLALPQRRIALHGYGSLRCHRLHHRQLRNLCRRIGKGGNFFRPVCLIDNFFHHVLFSDNQRLGCRLRLHGGVFRSLAFAGLRSALPFAALIFGRRLRRHGLGTSGGFFYGVVVCFAGAFGIARVLGAFGLRTVVGAGVFVGFAGFVRAIGAVQFVFRQFRLRRAHAHIRAFAAAPFVALRAAAFFGTAFAGTIALGAACALLVVAGAHDVVAVAAAVAVCRQIATAAGMLGTRNTLPEEADKAGFRLRAQR